MTGAGLTSGSGGNFTIGRMLVYALLILAAIYYLLPLFVMILTSVKTLEDIRTGILISLPT